MSTENRELIVSRVINAPCQRVWEVLANPAELIQWWGPQGFTNTFQEFNFKVGGTWRFMMHGPDGVDYPNQIVYTDIVEPALIAYVHGGDASMKDFHTTITLEKHGEGTLVTLKTIFETEADREQQEKFGAVEGGNQTLSRLDAFLAKKIIISRVINAPRERVFKAWLEPEQLMHWFYAAEGWKTPYAKVDPQVGGRFDIGFQSPDGQQDFAFEGAYHDIVSPERLSFSLGDGRPVAVTFTEQDGKTLLELELTLEGTNSEDKQREGWTAMLVHLDEHLSPTNK